MTAKVSSKFLNFFDMERFGCSSEVEIDKKNENLTHENTVKTHTEYKEGTMKTLEYFR